MAILLRQSQTKIMFQRAQERRRILHASGAAIVMLAVERETWCGTAPTC